MFEDETKLREVAGQVVAAMIAANVAEKKFYTDERVGKEYWNLVTPCAVEKDLIVIASLGYPELAGVWSYTLLRQDRISESSMEPYFREFSKRGYGLVAINPNAFDPDMEGDSFIYQLERVVAEIGTDQKIGFIGFSMGGRILTEYLAQRPGLRERVAGLVLIDPTLSNRLDVESLRRLLDNDTLLIASEGEIHSPGDIASVLLQIPKISFPGIHGEMPNKALGEVIKFYEDRTK